MYYSEFTLKIIEEVKKRPILYNTKFEKRPRQEKEEAWKEIASILNGKQSAARLLDFVQSYPNYYSR